MQICTAWDPCEREGDKVSSGSDWKGIGRESGEEAGKEGGEGEAHI